jgi:hypothetical protein
MRVEVLGEVERGAAGNDAHCRRDAGAGCDGDGGCSPHGLAVSVSSFAPVIVEHTPQSPSPASEPEPAAILVEMKDARIRIGSNAPSLTGLLPLWKKREQLSSVGTLQLLQQSSRRPAVDPHVHRLLILPYCPPRNRPKATVDCVRIVFFVA